jgi:hypothetical protein
VLRPSIETTHSIAEQNAEAFADKVFKAALGTMETLNRYLGDRLGWPDALAQVPATAVELADGPGVSHGYATGGWR